MPKKQERTAPVVAVTLHITGGSVIKHIYLVASDPNRAIKVGVSDKPLERIKALQIGSHETYYFVLCQAVNYADEVEKSLHFFLAPYKKRGEWFEIPAEVMDNLKHLLWSMDLNDDCKACNGEYNRKVLNIPEPQYAV